MQPRHVVLILYTLILIFDYYVLKAFDAVYANPAKGSEEFEIIKRFHSFYFTGWNFAAQMYFLVVAILDELAIFFDLPVDMREILTMFRSCLFTAIVFPCTLLVFSLFWCLYAIDRQLVFPKSLDDYYRPWMIHSMHSVILLPIIIETAMQQVHYPIKFKNAYRLLSAFLLVYQVTYVEHWTREVGLATGLLVEIVVGVFLGRFFFLGARYLAIYFLYDVWLYPVFNHLSVIQKILFFIMVKGCGALFLLFGMHLQVVVRRWRQDHPLVTFVH